MGPRGSGKDFTFYFLFIIITAIGYKNFACIDTLFIGLVMLQLFTPPIKLSNWTSCPYVSLPPVCFTPWTYSTFPRYSVNTQALGGKMFWGQNVHGRTDKVANVHKS